MRPKCIRDGARVGGEMRPRANPNEVLLSPSWCVVEASWGQVRAKMKQQWSLNGDTMPRRRRKKVPLQVQVEPSWQQNGAKSERRRSEDGPKIGVEPKVQNSRSAKTYGKTYVFVTRRGGELRKKVCQYGATVGQRWAPMGANMRFA